MATLPHDVTDLQLAPVALAVDARVEELGRLSAAELAHEIALLGDRPDRAREFREMGLLRTLKGSVELHHWELSLDPRGLRITHALHTLVIGIPASIRAYLEGIA